MNSSRRNIKEMTLGHIISRLLKTSDKAKTLEAARGEKKDTVCEEQNKHDSRLPVRNKAIRQQ